MKIQLKYGLFIALGAIAWVVLTHNVITNANSPIHQLGTPIFFNVLQFAMTYLGIKEFEREKGDRPTFKEGVKTGVGISVVYALILSLFFVVLLRVMGSRWMAVEPGAMAGHISGSQIAKAFVGLFIMTLIFGVIYSTVISFFLAKRAHESTAR